MRPDPKDSNAEHMSNSRSKLLQSKIHVSPQGPVTSISNCNKYQFKTVSNFLPAIKYQGMHNVCLLSLQELSTVLAQDHLN